MHQIKLDVRTPNIGPVFVGSYQIGGNVNSPWEPEVGNTATLRSGQVDILVRIDEVAGSGYKGTIFGFEGHDEPSFEGAQEGDSIEFEYKHLIGCSR